MGDQTSNRAYIRGMEGHLKAEPWSKQDLLFMGSSLRRGASFSEVAGFLGRPEGEVRAKAIELGIHVTSCRDQPHGRN
jgi:hypothetical protein